MWVGMLQDAGIPAMIRPSDTVAFLGVSGASCRVQVNKADVDRAREILGVDDGEPA
jgi:hypothetical protein